MSGIKDFFTMTRNERRGTIAVLVLIALLLAGSVAVRSCRQDVPIVETQSGDLERFDNETDTLSFPAARFPRTSSDSSRRSQHRHGKKHKSNDKPKPSKPAPRRMDPVPQF